MPLKVFCTNDFENSAFSLSLDVAFSCDAAAVDALFDHAAGAQTTAGGHCSAFRPLRSAIFDLNILRSRFYQLNVETDVISSFSNNTLNAFIGLEGFILIGTIWVQRATMMELQTDNATPLAFILK